MFYSHPAYYERLSLAHNYGNVTNCSLDSIAICHFEEALSAGDGTQLKNIAHGKRGEEIMNRNKEESF